MTTIATVDGDHVWPCLRDWLSPLAPAAKRLVIIEGLPGSGKSFLANIIADAIDLDAFLTRREDLSWVDNVVAGGAQQAIEVALASAETVIAAGVAAYPALTSIVENLPPGSVQRVYLKRVAVWGDYKVWDDGQGLREHAARSVPYIASYYLYHADDRPWEKADLVIERID